MFNRNKQHHDGIYEYKRSSSNWTPLFLKQTSGIKLSSVIHKRLLLLTIIVTLLVSFCSCSLFTTRDPEEPTGVQSGDDIARTAEEVFSIFKIS